MLALLTVSISINYIDRGNLSVGAHLISLEIPLTPASEGVLFSAFFWTYSICLFLSGLVIDRFPVTRLYAAGYFLWSLATILTAGAFNFTSLLLLRLVLGIGESVAYPCYSKILAARFVESERGFANALIDAGSKSGPAFGVLLGGLMLEHWGWRGMFLVLGGASMLWLIPWFTTTRHLAPIRRTSQPAPHPVPSLAPSIGAIIRRRAAWATFIGLFCSNYAWYFLLTWLPPYLVMERHYSTHAMAIFGSLPFWGVAASSLFGGWFSDRLIRRGADPSRVRKRFAAGGLLVSVLVLPAFLAHNNALSLALLIAACLSFGLYSSNVWAITQTLAGRHAAGKWTGLQNGFGNLAGVAAPFITGQIVGHTGSFYWAFATVAVIAVLGSACYVWLAGDIREIDWDIPSQAPDMVF